MYINNFFLITKILYAIKKIFFEILHHKKLKTTTKNAKLYYA